MFSSVYGLDSSSSAPSDAIETGFGENRLGPSPCRARGTLLANFESINPEDIPCRNRLSRLLFDLARFANREEGMVEERTDSRLKGAFRILCVSR